MVDHPRNAQPAAWLALALAAAAGLSSCGGPERAKVYPVRGRVVVGHVPAAHAWIVFHPQEASDDRAALRPHARAAPDGTFTLTCYEQGDGAPAGAYKVTVEWPGENPDDPSDPADPESRVPRGPDRLQGRYADPATTPLAATVVEGENQLETLQLQ